MITSSAALLNRWLVVELVDALLRPVFCAWRAEQRAGNDARAEVLARRFYGLVNSCDCWPCTVIIDRTGLYVLDGKNAEAIDAFDDEWSEEGAR